MDGDLGFVQAIVRNSTELAFKDFTKNYLQESVFTVTGKVSDVKEYGEEINGKTYKYLITLFQEPGESESAVLSSLSTVYCRFYTNADDVIRVNKGSTTREKGKVVGMSKWFPHLRSKTKVTGPSLISSTSMCSWKKPVFTST